MFLSPFLPGKTGVERVYAEQLISAKPPFTPVLPGKGNSI